MVIKKGLNLIEDNIVKVLVVYAIPLFFGQLFQSLYHSVDALVVGNFVDTNALASVNASANISNMLVLFFAGLSAGAGVVFAKYVGAKEYKKLYDSIHTTMSFTMITGTIIAVLGIFFAPQLLSLLKVDPAIEALALAYLRIYMIGVLFTAVYNVGASVVRSVGDSLSPFYHLVISSITNVVLDLLFVLVFHMGVNGVAYATIIAQFISVVLIIKRMQRLDERYAYNYLHFYINIAELKEVLALGLPAAVQSCITSIGHIFTNRYINGFGKAATAGIPTGQKIDQFVQLACRAISLAIPVFIAQNLGAGKTERAFKGVKISFWLVILFTTIPGIIVYFLAEPLARIFTPDYEVIQVIVGLLKVIMPFYSFLALQQIFSGINKGFQEAKFDMFNNIFSMVVVRQIYLAIGLKVNPTIETIYWCYPLSWALSGVLGLAYYQFVVKKKYIITAETCIKELEQ